MKGKTAGTYILCQDQVGLEVPVGVLCLGDPVSEGPVGLVPVDGHVGGGVVDQVVHIVPQLTGGRSSSCLKRIHDSDSLNGDR